jgi:MerR family transcriptional regulator, light-induced transcriptional regulator
MPGLYVTSPALRPDRHQTFFVARGGGDPPTVKPALPEVDADPGPDCVELLTRMVEAEIIPRLMLVHGVDPKPAMVVKPASVEASLVEDFARLTLTKDIDSLVEFVEGLQVNGVTTQSIYIDLLAPTARRLGDWWTADVCTFAEVTIGLGKLQQVLHELSRRSPATPDPKKPSRSVLLAAGPDEQHTFGLLVVEEFFRRAGWRTWCELGGDSAEVVRAVSAQRYDLFGLSVSCDDHLDRVTALITSVKRSSLNRSIRVMVGGRLFNERPDLAAGVGADITASEGTEAVAKAAAVCQLEGRHN